MKIKLFNFLFRFNFTILVFFHFFEVVAQPIVDNYSPSERLYKFATACNASQIQVLLASNTNFDLYDAGITKSPVMLAIDKFIIANNESPLNLALINECTNTIKFIMQDSRYQFKELPNRDKTDLMYLIEKGKSVANTSLALSGYKNLFYQMLNILDTKNGFDINYTLPFHPNNSAGNVIGSVATSGLKFVFCELMARYPVLKLNLDKKSRSSAYNALLLAVVYNNYDMLLALANNGADYYTSVDGFGNFPAKELATTLQRTTMINYLNNRSTGKSPAVTLSSYCGN